MRIVADVSVFPSRLSRRQTNPEALRRRYGAVADSFLEAMREGDEVRAFCSSKEAWVKRCGRRGYVLIREGKIVKRWMTGMN